MNLSPHRQQHDAEPGQRQGGQHGVVLNLSRMLVITSRGHRPVRLKAARLISVLAQAGTAPVGLPVIAASVWDRTRPIDEAFDNVIRVTVSAARGALEHAGIDIVRIRNRWGDRSQSELRLTAPVHVVAHE